MSISLRKVSSIRKRHRRIATDQSRRNRGAGRISPGSKVGDVWNSSKRIKHETDNLDPDSGLGDLKIDGKGNGTLEYRSVTAWWATVLCRAAYVIVFGVTDGSPGAQGLLFPTGYETTST